VGRRSSFALRASLEVRATPVRHLLSRNIMLKKVVSTGVLLAAVAASVGGYYLRRSAPEVSVSTTTVTSGDVIQGVSATGTLEALRTVEVGSQVSGTISRLHADFNSIVRKGQLLAELDPSLLQAQAAQARANVQSAAANVDRLTVVLEDARTSATRAEALNARQLVTQSELEAARLAVRVAEAQLRAGQAQLGQAKASLDQCVVNEQHANIYSPIDGIVISRTVDVGQTVAASMQAPTLFTIAADLSHMQLKAAVSESDVGLVREGQAVSFRVDAYSGEIFNGSVAQVRLQPTTSQNVVTYTTVIDVPNQTLRLRPGMTATTTIVIARANGALRVPNTALRFRPTPAMFAALAQPLSTAPAATRPGAGAAQTGTTARVWAWVNGQLQPVALSVGISDGTFTEIVAGAPTAKTPLVTSLMLPSGSATASTTSPLMQQSGPPSGMPPPPPPGMGGGPR
jgi:HlyD family secretion protein